MLETDIQLPVFQDVADLEHSELLSAMSGREKERYLRQEIVLSRYAQTKNRTFACAGAGVTVRTHERWLADDTYGYRKRLAGAKEAYSDYLSSMVTSRLKQPEGARGSDLLLIAAKNAVDPDWKGNTTTIELGDEFQQMMIKLQAEHTKQLEASTTVEGSSKVLEPLDFSKYKHPGDE